MNKKISEVVDHHATPGQRHAVFAHLVADARARKTWQCYHLIGCVLRGEVEQTGADLSARICARLEAEPTARVASRLPSLAHLSNRLSARLSAQWSARIPMWKSAGMLALAASVALLAVVTFQLLQPLAEPGGVNRIAADSNAKFRQEVGEMLTQHGEFTSSPGLNGLVVYAKLVSDEPIGR